jgi:sugar O-acyltransferase (sialic acid O-acetyltransferase NeuD family)
VGFVDSFKEKGTKINGYEVLGSEYDLPYLMEQFKIEGGIVAVGDNWNRQQFVDKILSIHPGFTFISVVHPSAIIGKGVSLGKGSVVLPGVIVNANATVGDHCILNTKASLDHDCRMGNYASLAPGAFTGGNVIIGEGAAICLGAKIIERVTIGDHSVVGSNSLVLKDIPKNTVVYGSPAQIIRKRSPWEPYLRNQKQHNSLQLRLNYTGT